MRVKYFKIVPNAPLFLCSMLKLSEAQVKRLSSSGFLSSPYLNQRREQNVVTSSKVNCLQHYDNTRSIFDVQSSQG